jgi:hypothetical protein
VYFVPEGQHDRSSGQAYHTNIDLSPPGKHGWKTTSYHPHRSQQSILNSDSCFLYSLSVSLQSLNDLQKHLLSRSRRCGIQKIPHRCNRMSVAPDHLADIGFAHLDFKNQFPALLNLGHENLFRCFDKLPDDELEKGFHGKFIEPASLRSPRSLLLSCELSGSYWPRSCWVGRHASSSSPPARDPNENSLRAPGGRSYRSSR